MPLPPMAFFSSDCFLQKAKPRGGTELRLPGCSTSLLLAPAPLACLAPALSFPLSPATFCSSALQRCVWGAHSVYHMARTF